MSRSWLTPLTLPAPSLADNTADAERLERAFAASLGLPLSEVCCARDLLPALPSGLPRAAGERVALGVPDRGGLEIVDVVEPAEAPFLLGLAVDLGTTRIVARLLRLQDGATLGETSFDNPQIAIGPDILVRIHHAGRPEGLAELGYLVRARLNAALAQLSAAQGRRPEDCRLFAVAGNTAMTHLLLGLPPGWLIREPYVPVVNRPGVMRAADLGLVAHPRARLYAFPNVGSYFGGDLIAGILYAGLERAEAPEILVDVGTNAEVVFGNRDWLIACAGAAGPALEGGVSRMGMMAGPGAIDRVRVAPDGRFELHTIGEARPLGICGSGLIDLAAALFRTGRIDIRGKLVPAACGDRLGERDGMREYLLVRADETAQGEDLTLRQADLDSLIRSKAAMYTILETLTAEVGLTPADAARIRIAGTFGQFIDPESAITIGMLPDLPRETYSAIGNSSLEGACLLLVDRGVLTRAEALRDRITYLELNVNQAFMNRFSGAKFIPHTDPGLFPTVRIPPQP